MCAIFGVGFQRGCKICNNEMVREIIRNLFLENMVRGRTASGLAYVSGKEIQVIKKNTAACDFIQLPDYKKSNLTYLKMSNSEDSINSEHRPVSVLGHCRLKTKGTELNNVNNHPIIRDNIVGVHNGMISNDDYLFDHYSDKFKRNGKVDSEIIFALIEHYSGNNGTIVEAIQKANQEIYGGFACAMVHRFQPYIVWLFRNSNPCSIFHYKDSGLVIWSSMPQFIRSATKGYTLGEPEEIEFPAETGIAIDLYQNKFYRFKLKDQGKETNAGVH